LYTLALAVVFVVIASQTYIWHYPDVLSLAEKPDSSVLWGTDTVLPVSAQRTAFWCDGRHPLYVPIETLFQPFYYLLTVLGCFLSGGCTWGAAFWASYSLVQIALCGVILIMMKRMVQPVLGKELAIAMLFWLASSFSWTIFALIPEKLFLTTFTLVAYLYFYVTVILKPCFPGDRGKSLKPMEHFLAVAAVGTTVLSGVVVLGAMFVRPYRSIREFFQTNFLWAYLLVGFYIVTTTIVSPEAHTGIKIYVSWWDVGRNTLQFLHFAESCIFFPSYEIFSEVIEVKETPITAVPAGYLWTGGGILALCCVGFVAHWRNRFMLVAFLWLLLGYGVMGICGWGAVLNEMSLYAPYYSWAVVPLAVGGLRKCLGNEYHQTTLLVLVCAGVALVMNLHTIYTVTQVFREICPWP
ncbi:MAG: hypothetical protein Q4E67_05615, partial [Planctomycetia bacterium]|nr:hypothetical protein [Planctomycetia bacterium]